MLKEKLKRYIPDELLEIYYSFHQKRFEYSMLVPSTKDVLTVGLYTYGAENLKILFRDSGENVQIGKFSSIAKNVTILLGGGHRHDWITTYPFGHMFQSEFGTEKREGHPKSKGSVIIGNDVWIGMGATIMSGVTVGDGAVIAANSHIINDVPSFGVVGGNPGKLIRFRFDSDIILRLLAISWWDFPNIEVNKIKMVISQEPTEEILSQLESMRSLIDAYSN